MRPLEIFSGAPLDLVGKGSGEHEGAPVPGHGGVVDTDINLSLEPHVEHPVGLGIREIDE